jgi:small neutral amino acid transporter SnatA (MarC family)
LLRGRTAPAARRLVSVVLIVALIAIGGLAVLATWVAALLAFIVACGLALDLIVARMSAEDPVLRRFRRQLAALPETVHPHGY